MSSPVGGSITRSRGSQGGNGTAEDSAGFECRAGARVLSLFTTPLNVLILRALAGGPLRLTDLRREVGGPAQTTLRGHLGNLIGFGALEKHRPDGRPNTIENALTPMGVELLEVAGILQRWLDRAPQGAIALESEAGKAAVKALIGGWDSTMLRAFAARPFSLTELDSLITALTYPALERRLSALHLAGQVEPVPSEDKGTPYAVTEWMRTGVAPLIAAARCERRHLRGTTAPPTRIDIEALLLLAVPLLRLPDEPTGGCQLVVDGGEESRPRAVGASVTLERGRVVGCSSKLEGNAPTTVRGSLADWFDAIVDGDGSPLLVEGSGDLGRQVVAGLSRALFPDA